MDTDPSKIILTRALRNDASKNIKHSFNAQYMLNGLYRPFCKQNLYFDTPFIEAPGIHSKIFPIDETKNLSICISGIGLSKDFSSLITDKIPCLDLVDKSQYILDLLLSVISVSIKTVDIVNGLPRMEF
jgi:predicted helicase